MHKVFSLLLLLCAVLVLPAHAQVDRKPAPDATKKPAKRVLVFNRADGFKHSSIPTSAEVFKQLDAKSEDFEFVVTDDVKHFDKDKLDTFDAVAFCLTTGEYSASDPKNPGKPEFTDAHKAALLDFVKSGRGGLAGMHSATDTFYKWPEFGDMLGGYFDGHPWNAVDKVTIKNEQPDHAISKPWGTQPFELVEEMYQFKDPYSRAKQDVLMSIDVDKTDMTKKGIKRTDKDFAVAWTKSYGKGRVFYTSLGHNEAVWNDPRYQAHLMAGLKWVTGGGDAKAETKTPKVIGAK
ncbi:MAG: ThuA domain-containing protein [Tepidisphaeraceae bacterium]